MSAAFDLTGSAARLVADLMPIAVTVSGPDAARFAGALAEAGAGAEVFAPGQTGFDLAILLAPLAKDGTSAATVGALAEASDRLLFVPVPLGTTDVPDLDSWFELFAEQGYQPVVEYDATFLGQGAFLVDRNATAAESELASFAERVSLGGALAASTQRVAALEAELGDAGDRAALKNALAERDAALAARTTALVATWAKSPQRDGLAGLREASGRMPKRPFYKRWRRGAPPADKAERRLLEEAALVRASKLFDPVWYIASQPALAESAGDPVWHYVLHGAPSGCDPGPYFDSAAYVARTPGVTGNPLVHAIRNGAEGKGSASF